MALKLEDCPQTWEKGYVLETFVPKYRPSNSSRKAERDAYKKHVDDYNEFVYPMMATITLSSKSNMRTRKRNWTPKDALSRTS